MILLMINSKLDSKDIILLTGRANAREQLQPGSVLLAIIFTQNVVLDVSFLPVLFLEPWI